MMKTKRVKRFFSAVLACVMLIGMLPAGAYAATTASDSTTTSTNVAKVQSYAAQLRNANTAGKTTGKYTWDTEGKSYSWAYFNGLMLDALDMVGGTENTSFTDAFYAANINDDGSIVNLASGAASTGALDSVEPIRAVFDVLSTSSNADKYKAGIQTIYTMLENQITYSDCGGNFAHKQDNSTTVSSSWSSYPIALDGLYMAEPFLMECANAIDAGNLTLTDKNGNTVNSSDIYTAVYNRFVWVYENMYDSNTKLYNHAYNPSTGKTNGIAWSRAIGWYAMALVDTIDMMPTGDMKTALEGELTQIFDGLLKYQDAETGMWYNITASKTEVSENELETSSTSMFAYAMMKAYNNGWVTDTKYAEAGLKAFNGVVANKMTGSEGNYSVADTYKSSGAGTTASYYTTSSYTTNEAKGVGALIMASTLANATVAKLAENVPATLTDATTKISVSGSKATALTVETSKNSNVAAAVASILESGYAAYDFTLTGYTEGTEATVKFPIPDTVTDTSKFAVYYVPESGDAVKMDGSADNGYYVFKTTHFSTYVGGVLAAANDQDTPTTGGNDSASNAVTASGYLAKTMTSTTGVTTTTYTLASSIDTDGEYLIASGNSGTVSILGHSNTTATSAAGTVSGTTLTVTTSNFSDTNYLWKFSSKSSGTVSNNNVYIYPQNGSVFNSSSKTVAISMSNSAVKISYSTTTQSTKPGPGGGSTTTTYYLRYTSSKWTTSTNSGSVYLYKKGTTTTYPETTVQGDAVTLSVTPSSASLNAYNKETATLKPTVTVGASAAAATSSTITWASSDTSVATVDQNGVVTSVAAGTANITATLTEANGSSIYKDSSSTDSLTVTIPVTVTYTEKKTPIQDYTYGDVTTTASSYAEYPDDGAVRIDKTATGCDFATTGVANVELDAAGISVKTGVDVVLVLDVSNSMAWSVEKLNAGKTGTDACPDTGKNSKLDDAVDAMTSFTNILLGGNTGSAASDNTVSLVTFGGYDKQNTAQTTSYFDSVQTVFSSCSKVADAIDIYDSMSLKYDSSSSTSYTLSINGTSGANYGNTCYDYGFYQAYDAITTLQSAYKTNTGTDYADSGRVTYVVFMTDGAPSNYEYKYYKSGSNDYYPGTTTKYTLQGSSSPCSADNWYSYISTTQNTLAKKVYDKVNGNMTVIGFDLDHGGFNSYQWTGDKLPNFLKQMVSGATLNVTSADDSAALNSFYTSLAGQIKYAATKAQVTDTIKSDYTLQMGSTAGTGTTTISDIPSDITVKAYDLYTKTDTTDASKIGTRKGTSSTLETVTFNKAGTEAYSDVLNSGNIMTTNSDGSIKIDAYYFTYTKDTNGTEKFVWKIGNITDKEVALSYYVYLKGALEGEAEKGIYDTNESAVIDYIDINGDKAQKTYPVPALAWGGASTAYEFYLVNANGDPVNHAGQVVPFANRVIISGPTYKTLNINQSATVEAATVKASEVLPEGYYLYDQNASYTVTTSGGNLLTGKLTVSDPSSDASATKGGVEQSGAQTTIVVSFDEKNFTQSRVAFGVRWDLTPSYVDTALNNDQIVIDYGLSIDADVLANDPSLYSGYTRTLVGFTAYNDTVKMNQIQRSAGSETFTTDNGTYTIVKQKVRFTPSTMISTVDKVFCVVEYSSSSDTIYLYEELDVIPANSILYEDEFAAITYNNGGAEWKVEGTASTDPQSDGTVGSDSPYGYDSVYNDDTAYSNGSAHVINVTSDVGLDNLPTVTFTFAGTGFDLISRTGDSGSNGLVKAVVKDTNGDVVKTVSVQNTGEQNLYQIPVISIDGLTYGTYSVTITAYPAYSSDKFPALDRGGTTVLDAVRVYQPADESDSIVKAAYATDKESHVKVMELRDAIIDAASFNAIDDEETEGIVYVDGESIEGNSATVADYTSVGPNNEVYLNSSSGTLAFILETSAEPASVQIGAKSVSGSATLYAKAVDPEKSSNCKEKSYTMTQATAQNYVLNVSDCVKMVDGKYQVYLYISNTGSGTLSLTDLKVTFASDAENPTAAFVYNPKLINLEYLNSIASPDITTVSLNGRATFLHGTKLTVTTSYELPEGYTFVVKCGDRQYLTTAKTSMKKLTVSQGVKNSDGTFTYTLTFHPNRLGNHTITVYVVNSSNQYSQYAVINNANIRMI